MVKSHTEQRRRLENHVGLVIRKRRQELTMSQTQLANRIGTTKEIISNYEIGVTPVRADDLPLFADVLNLSLSDFYPALSVNEPALSVNEIVETTEAGSEARMLALHKWHIENDPANAYRYEPQHRQQRESQYDLPWVVCDPNAEFVMKYQQLDEGTRIVALNILDTLLADLRNRQRGTKQI